MRIKPFGVYTSNFWIDPRSYSKPCRRVFLPIPQKLACSIGTTPFALMIALRLVSIMREEMQHSRGPGLPRIQGLFHPTTSCFLATSLACELQVWTSQGYF
jgi:hypothetical protein